MDSFLNEQLNAHRRVIEALEAELPSVDTAILLCVKALNAGHKILLCGNGGSAADAQHIAAELVGRFVHDRKALPAIALTTDSSALTAIGNDYGFDDNVITYDTLDCIPTPNDYYKGDKYYLPKFQYV